MDNGFEGQVAIVTGGATGIGFDIARQLIGSGANVILNDLDPELLRRAAERIGAGNQLITIDGDAGDLRPR